MFQKPVNPKEAPDYYNVIKYPIDLSKMREVTTWRIKGSVTDIIVLQKNTKFCYKSRGDFMSDILLMVNNCREYNHIRNPHLLPTAERLHQAAQDELVQVLVKFNLNNLLNCYFKSTTMILTSLKMQC